LAEGYFSAELVHEGWMNSEGHRENILSENFKEIGVAILEFEQNDQKSYFSVQHFGSQLTEEDLITKVICEKDSKENCEESKEREEHLDDLIEEQEEIIKKAKEQNVSAKELNRLEENLENLEDADDELEDYLEECEKFLNKCDEFE
jgi:DNA-binding transcriptional regulator GbsR (MarR family)